jgi:formyl-CoA transferase
MMPYTTEQWRRLFAAVGKEELLEQPWFADHAERLLQAERVYGELAAIVAEGSTEDWLKLCYEEGIPANPVPSLDEILDDPDLHRGVVEMADHPVVGPYRSVKPGLVLDDAPLTVRRPAPLRGEHTAEVLAEVGYTPAAVEQLAESGAVQVVPVP